MKRVFAIFIVFLSLFIVGCDKTSEDKIDKVVLEGEILQTEFYLNDELYLSSSWLDVYYKSGIVKKVDLTIDMVYDFDTSTCGTHVMKIKYEDFVIDFEYEVLAPHITNIRYVGEDLVFYLHETPDFSSAKIFALYSDGSEELVTCENLSFGEIDYTLDGEKKIEISYKNLSILVPYVVCYRPIDISAYYDLVYENENYVCAFSEENGGRLYLNLLKISNESEVYIALKLKVTENEAGSYTASMIVDNKDTLVIIYLANNVLHIEPI